MRRESTTENTVVTASFDIKFTRYLDASGEPVNALPTEASDPTILTAFYRALYEPALSMRRQSGADERLIHGDLH